MHPIGFCRLSWFLTVWVGSAFSIPVALALAYNGIYEGVYIILAYYSYRFFFPAKVWLGWKKIMRMNEPGRTYCNSQHVVFEKSATVPKPGARNMLCVAPHGILTIGYTFLCSSEEFEQSGTRWLVADALTQLPFVSDVMAWSDIWGCSAVKMKKHLTEGHNLAIIPGGFQEATLFTRGKHHVYIKSRKGFVKYALQYGYQLQPAYVFGEEWTYWQYAPKFLNPARLWLNKYSIPATFFVGKWFFILPDNDIDINIVVGKPLVLPHIANPSEEDVNEWHAKYIEALRGVFERNKKKYCKGGSEKEDLLVM